MNFATYIPLAVRTCKELPLSDHINHMALGVVGEMGEIIDQLKKAYIYGKTLDQVNIVEEVGDVAWYVAGILNSFPGAAIDAIMTTAAMPVNPEVLAEAQATTTRSILSLNSHMCDLLGELQQAVDEGDMKTAEAGAKIVYAMLYALAELLNVDLEQACEVNIAKLAKRYGDKYSDYAAVNRDLEGERAVLEAGTLAAQIGGAA